MQEKDFSNREIGMMFNEIKQDLVHIVEQTTKHNGRMTKIEEKQLVFETLNARKEGALNLAKYIGIFCASILIAYLGWLGNKISNINNTLTIHEIQVQQ